MIRKRFGQHFLHDRQVLQRIVSAVAPLADDALVEIGPGSGALTAALLEKIDKLHAVEIDRDLAAQLRQRFGDQLQLHEGDALRFDFANLAQTLGRPLRLVGNLPYNVSTPLLFHWLEQRKALVDLTVMLQKEVVDRMAAKPDTSAYGRLTVMLAPYFQIEKLFEVGPGAFTPPPKVWSAVVRLKILQQTAFPVPPAFGPLVAQAFSQRRKTLRKSLKGLIDDSAFEQTRIAPEARPETLAPAQFAQLAQLARL